MNSIHAAKVERFRKRIEFDATLKAENVNKGVSVVWPNMLAAPSLGEGPWRIASDSTWRSSGGVAREWVLRRGAEQISVLIFVSSEGSGPAQRFLLSRATENMMVDTPYIKSQAGLGSLAVSMPQGAPPNLIWVFHNVCFDVSAIDSQVDVIAIARWLQAKAEEGIVASEAARLRAPGAIQVSSRKETVGMAIDIRVPSASAADESRYMIELEYDSQLVEVVSLGRLAARIRGRAAGHTVLDLHLIDMTTLLSVPIRIELEFIPAKK